MVAGRRSACSPSSRSGLRAAGRLARRRGCWSAARSATSPTGRARARSPTSSTCRLADLQPRRHRDRRRVSCCSSSPRARDRKRESSRPPSSTSTTTLIVVDKPPGLVVHPAPSYSKPTSWTCSPTLAGGGESGRPGIVHRLDRDTSGLMVVARNDEAHASLPEQIKSRSAVTEYTALVEGRLDSAARHRRRAVGRGTGAGARGWRSRAPARATPAPTSR